MKILVVSYRFPPFNSIGAVRIGKLAKYLSRAGHDVRVLTCGDQPLPKTLSLEISPDLVFYTSSLDVNYPINRALGGNEKIASKGYDIGGRGFLRKLKGLADVYKAMTNLPDAQIGWFPPAVRKGKDIMKSWQPDIIYASGHPLTSLLVAASLSRHGGVPWVAELRDLWADNPYNKIFRWRSLLDGWLERRTLGSANSLVTVTPGFVKALADRYPEKNVTLALNGFDDEDYRTPSHSAFADGYVHIVYTGLLYEGKRDPEKLFQAIEAMGEDASKFRIHFYGRNMSFLWGMLNNRRVKDCVEIHDPVPYAESVSLQKAADILLLILWDHPEEESVIPGKIFEYMGARRPILSINGRGHVAGFFEGRNIGINTHEVGAIQVFLATKLAEKQASGAIAGLSAEATSGFTRLAMADKIAHELTMVVSGS